MCVWRETVSTEFRNRDEREDREVSEECLAKNSITKETTSPCPFKCMQLHKLLYLHV